MTKKDKRLVKDKQKELANPNKVRKMKSFDLADDEQALNWLDLQRNQTASMKVLIDVAINLFGYVDLVILLKARIFLHLLRLQSLHLQEQQVLLQLLTHLDY